MYRLDPRRTHTVRLAQDWHVVKASHNPAADVRLKQIVAIQFKEVITVTCWHDTAACTTSTLHATYSARTPDEWTRTSPTHTNRATDTARSICNPESSLLMTQMNCHRGSSRIISGEGVPLSITASTHTLCHFRWSSLSATQRLLRLTGAINR